VRKPQHVYSVRFAARELWGGQAKPQDSVYLIVEDYLTQHNSDSNSEGLQRCLEYRAMMRTSVCDRGRQQAFAMRQTLRAKGISLGRNGRSACGGAQGRRRSR